MTYMIMDLQYGSTGKGLLAGYLAKTWKPDVVVSAFGPNAGHTFIDSTGEYIHTMLAMGVFSDNIEHVLIGPGSVLDVTKLQDEIKYFVARAKTHNFTVWIHPNTPILYDYHKAKEAEFVAIGSTMKGTAACMMDKMVRSPAGRVIAMQHCEPGFWFNIDGIEVRIANHGEYQSLALNAECLQIEGAQGYSLSIHGPFYPYCTSRDVSYHQLMSDCGLPASITPLVIGTARTFPIRVANRYTKSGNQIGYSGDCYTDQQETTWEKIGVKPEQTTVTKLERRVFTFSMQQITEAVQCNAVDEIFLNFCNYLGPKEVFDLVDRINNVTSVKWLGYGPKAIDIRSLNNEH